MATSRIPELNAAAGTAAGVGAAERATRQALSGVGGEAAQLLIFASDLDPGRAAAEATSAAGDIPVAGMTGSGVIGEGGAIQCGCSVLALSSDAPVGVGLANDAGGSLAESSAAATAEALAAVGGDASAVLLMVDTRSGDQAVAVAGAYGIAGPSIPIVGGGAGGDEPAQIAMGSAHEDSVVAVAFGGGSRAGVGLAHGCRRRGTPAIATRAEGRLLRELDGRAAADVYLERLGYQGIDLSPDQFATLAVTHPLAQPELSGQWRLRHVLGRRSDGSLECATHIPANAAIEFTHQTPEDIVAASSRAVRAALDDLGERRPRAALIFDCAGRKRAVADALEQQVGGLLDGFGAEPPPLAGLFSHGEICRTRGAKGDRNHAVVVAALG